MIEGFEVINNIASISDFLKLGKTIGKIIQQTDDHGSGITTLSPKILINKQAYNKSSLYVHTDRSTLEYPPDYVLFWYEKMPEHGGSPVIFDAQEMPKDRVHEFNFEAVFMSENDNFINKYKFYDEENNIFRFRRDKYIYVNNNDLHRHGKLIDYIDHNSIIVKIIEGQCLLVNNKHVLHGRTAFSGDRVLHRIHIIKDAISEQI